MVPVEYELNVKTLLYEFEFEIKNLKKIYDLSPAMPQQVVSVHHPEYQLLTSQTAFEMLARRLQ